MSLSQNNPSAVEPPFYKKDVRVNPKMKRDAIAEMNAAIDRVYEAWGCEGGDFMPETFERAVGLPTIVACHEKKAELKEPSALTNLCHCDEQPKGDLVTLGSVEICRAHTGACETLHPGLTPATADKLAGRSQGHEPITLAAPENFHNSPKPPGTQTNRQTASSSPQPVCLPAFLQEVCCD